ncbi:MAG: hypothetical protein ACP5SK_05415 [Thermoprotei archaeon]
MTNQNKALYGLLATTLLLAGFSLALADVIFTYTGYVNVSVTSPPITFSLGPNNAVNGFVSTAVYPTGFTVNVAVTNAAEIYYYEPLELTVSTNGYLYINNETVSGSDLIENMYAEVATANGAGVESIQLIASGNKVPYPSTGYTLSPGTYYISLWIEPLTPSTSGSETISVSFGYNVVSTSISVPTP